MTIARRCFSQATKNKTFKVTNFEVKKHLLRILKEYKKQRKYDEEGDEEMVEEEFLSDENIPDSLHILIVYAHCLLTKRVTFWIYWTRLWRGCSIRRVDCSTRDN